MYKLPHLHILAGSPLLLHYVPLFSHTHNICDSLRFVLRQPFLSLLFCSFVIQLHFPLWLCVFTYAIIQLEKLIEKLCPLQSVPIWSPLTHLAIVIDLCCISLALKHSTDVKRVWQALQCQTVCQCILPLHFQLAILVVIVTQSSPVYSLPHAQKLQLKRRRKTQLHKLHKLTYVH